MRYVTPSGRIFCPYSDMLEQPHLLIAGATGSGKSVLINGLISTAAYKSPAEARLVLLDPKTTELHQWSRMPHTIAYAYETDDMLKALRQTIEMMENRLRHMHSVGERVWTGAQIYVVIDELADMLTTNKAATVPLIQRICQLGRAAGIHCIAATQCILSTVLPTPVRVNFSAVVCLRTATRQQSRFIADAPGAEQFPNPRTEGRAFAFYRTGADIKKLQLYKVPDDEQNRLVMHWTSSSCTI